MQMPFADLLESLTPLSALARILAGLGLVAALVAYLRRVAERRRWRRFKQRVQLWIDQLDPDDDKHPKQLDDHDWRVACEQLLFDCNYSPSEIDELMDLAVLIAKSTAVDRLL